MQRGKMGRKECSKSARNVQSFHLAQTPLPVSRAFLGERAQTPHGAVVSAIAGNDGNICYPKLG